MDGIADILSRKDFDVPPELQAIKEYVRRHYNQDVTVTMQQRGITVSARSSGLIASLRLNVSELQKVAQTDKKLYFRIG